MWVFLISGLIGGFIPQYLAVYSFILVPPPGVVFDMGSTLIVALFVNLIAGLLGGYSGYRLFNRIKSTNIYKKIAMIVVSAILGLVFSSLNFICYLPQ